MTTRECYIRDVIALENKEPKKKKGTLSKPRPRGGGLAGAPAELILQVSKIF